MKFKKIFVVMAIATLIISMAIATASATTDIKSEKKDTEISIESKEKKVSSYKIKWDANGGKIGSKKTKVTSVRKGSKINKLVATPKRTGFTFKGWYSKKTGGKKISKNTKPTKSVTLYAQWSKKSSSRVLTAEEKKLVGPWRGAYKGHSFYYQFRADGKYSMNVQQGGAYEGTRPVYVLQRGDWSKSGETMYFTNNKVTSWQGTDKPPANIVWKSIGKSKMSISMHEADDSSSVRYIRDLGRNGLMLQNEPLPSWLYI